MCERGSVCECDRFRVCVSMRVSVMVRVLFRVKEENI